MPVKPILKDHDATLNLDVVNPLPVPGEDVPKFLQSPPIPPLGKNVAQVGWYRVSRKQACRLRDRPLRACIRGAEAHRREDRVMEKINRRPMLAAIPACGLAPAVLAKAAPADVSAITPRQRLNAAIAELKAAAQEMDPNIERWNIGWAEDDRLVIGFSAVAYRRTGQYEGDGIYEGGPDWRGRHTKYQVRLLDRQIDGHRTFEVRSEMDRMVQTEPCLNTFIRRRVA